MDLDSSSRVGYRDAVTMNDARKEWRKMNRLQEFREQVKNAPTDKKSEKVVRYMLEEVAKDCPMHVLVQLGQRLIDCRKSELREEAERN